MKRLQPGEQVLIIDAGDATIDISTYKVLGSRPLQVEELCEPKRESGRSSWWFFCSIASVLGLIQGGDLVTMRATEAVRGAFCHSTYKPITQSATRDAGGLEIQHPREPGSVFPGVRQRGKENLFE